MQTAEDKLRAFARELFEHWPEAAGVDGFQLQDLGEKHGLLAKKDPAPRQPCGENCACREYYPDEDFHEGAVICYQRTEVLDGEKPCEHCHTTDAQHALGCPRWTNLLGVPSDSRASSETEGKV